MQTVSKIQLQPSDSSPPRPPARNPRAPKILFFTRILPEPGSNGSGAYAADILEYLRRHGCEIRIVWTETPDRIKYTFYNTLPSAAARAFDIRPHNCYRIGKHVFNPSAIWLPRKARLLYFLKRLLQRFRLFPDRPRTPAAFSPSALQSFSPSWDTPCTPAERAFLYEHTAGYRPDILIANYPWMLAGLEKKHTSPHHWVLTSDYRFRRCSLAPGGRFLETYVAPEARAAERRILSAADLLIAIQQNEAAAYRADHPHKTVLTACMSVRSDTSMPPPSAEIASLASDIPHSAFRTPHSIVAFIGSAHAGNQQSALWFVREVWPLILRNHPHARLRVAGRVCDILAPLKRNERPRVELLGHIPDLAAFYENAALAVVPILEGSGVKIKLLEAISHNRPAVTTSVGLDGLEFLRPALSIADTPRASAAAVLRLLRDPALRARQSAAALALAREFLTPEACYAPLLAAARAAIAK